VGPSFEARRCGERLRMTAEFLQPPLDSINFKTRKLPFTNL
jgi:hypothetical protein